MENGGAYSAIWGRFPETCAWETSALPRLACLNPASDWPSCAALLLHARAFRFSHIAPVCPGGWAICDVQICLSFQAARKNGWCACLSTLSYDYRLNDCACLSKLSALCHGFPSFRDVRMLCPENRLFLSRFPPFPRLWSCLTYLLPPGNGFDPFLSLRAACR